MAVAVAVFFIASATRVGWVHIADAVLWGVVLFSAAVPWVSLPGLKLRRSVQAQGQAGLAGPVEGAVVRVGVAVRNRWPVARFMVATRFQAADVRGASTRRYFFHHLPGRSEVGATKNVVTTVRGAMELGPIVIEASAPFGLFRRRRTVGSVEMLLVYPRWYEMKHAGLVETTPGEDESAIKARVGMDVSGARRYVAGDPRRNIHWRNTARSGHMMAKEFDTWSGRLYVMAFGAATNGAAQPDGTAFDYAVRVAASAARPLMARGGTVMVAANGRLGAAFTSWPELMAELARLRPVPSHEGASSLGFLLPPGARVLGLLVPQDTAMTAELVSLTRRGHEVSAVVFQGFTQGEEVGRALVRLTSAGAAVAVCKAGAIEAAITDIEAGTIAVVARKGARQVAQTGISGAVAA